MVGVASGLEVDCADWERKGFCGKATSESLKTKHSWLQLGRKPFFLCPQASASPRCSAGALGPSPGCPPQAYSVPPERWAGTYGACSSPGGPVIWEH